MKTALVTGASGFIGMRLCEDLLQAGWRVAACVRSGSQQLPNGVHPIPIENLATYDFTGAGSVASQYDVVYHLAARAHRLRAAAADSSTAAYPSDDLVATQVVYQWAKQLGVQHMVFLSSIKVLGDTSDKPLTVAAPYLPQDSYARSKIAAEQFLMRVTSAEGGDDSPAVTIVRPPLVYGAGVKGNFAQLMAVVASAWPLPLGRARAQRSMVYVGNLTDLLLRLNPAPVAACTVYHVKDDEDLTVAQLVRSIARSMDLSIRLLPVPEPLMNVLASLTHKRGSFDRLFRSLRIDDEKTRRDLDWAPPFPVSEALRRTVEAWVR